MRPQWLAAVAGGAALVAIVGCSWRQSSSWPHHLAWFSSGSGQLLSASRLVHEEDIRGPSISDDDEDVALLARMPRGASGWCRAIVRRASQKLSQWLRIEELQRRRPRRRRSATDKNGENDIAPVPVDTFQHFVQESLLVTAMVLKLMGALLPVLTILTLLEYWVLSIPGQLQLQPLTFDMFFVDVVVERLEWLVLPALLLAARIFRIPKREALGEDVAGPESMKRMKRVLLGVLVLVVLSSLMAVVALALFVLVVRLTGGLK